MQEDDFHMNFDQIGLNLYICQKLTKSQILHQNTEHQLITIYTYYLYLAHCKKNVEVIAILRKCLFLVIAAIYNGGSSVGHSFEREPFKDPSSQV